MPNNNEFKPGIEFDFNILLDFHFATEMNARLDFWYVSDNLVS